MTNNKIGSVIFVDGDKPIDIVTTDDIYSRFVDFQDLIYGVWSFGGTGQFSVQVGLIQIVIVILTILLFFKLFKKSDKLRILYWGALFVLLASLFLMLNESSFIWEKITILQKFQFPWRLLTLVVFTTSLIGAMFVSKINLKRKDVLVFLLVLFAIIPTISYWQAKEYKEYKDPQFESIIESTTDTGESAPIWSVRFMEQKSESEIEIIEGEADIQKIKRKSTHHEYVIDIKERSITHIDRSDESDLFPDLPKSAHFIKRDIIDPIENQLTHEIEEEERALIRQDQTILEFAEWKGN